MTSAKSCKNPERTWFMEMVRRCKALPVLIAVAYFLANILPILLAYNRLERVIAYVYSSMAGSNVLNLGIGIVGGIVVSCAVFRYLHSTDSVIAAHARPQTRTQLFRGSFFAGLLMVTCPVVLTGLFYLCVMGAHSSTDLTELMKDWVLSSEASHALCVSNIIGWTLDNIVVIGFTYCVSCFAAILAGTAVIQALLSLLLISLATIVYLFFEGYMNTFLYGFVGNTDVTKYLSPYGYLVMRGQYPFAAVPVTLIIYVAISALVAFAAVAIYKRIKLENEEQTIVVPFVAECLVILLTAVSVSVVLFIARSFLSVDSTAGSVITIILATVVFFPVYCMIADQSFRIFKGRNVRVFIIYAAVMCLVLAFTLFDVTGFEKHVPEASEVESVTISDSNLLKPDWKNITDKETITRITALHESIAEVGNLSDDSAFTPVDQSKDGQVSSIGAIELTYKLKNGKKLSRYYTAIYSDSFDRYADFFNSKPVRKHECMDENHPLLAGQYMSIYDAHVDNDGGVIDDTLYMIPEKNVKGITKAVNKDIMNWTAENRGIFNYSEEYDPAKDKSAYELDVRVDYRIPSEEATQLEEFNRYYLFTDDDQNMVKYMKEHPEIMTKKNVIEMDDPILGGDETY